MARILFVLFLSACTVPKESTNNTLAFCIASLCSFSEADKIQDIEGDNKEQESIKQEGKQTLRVK